MNSYFTVRGKLSVYNTMRKINVLCFVGKSGAIHGKVHDATPFTFSEDRDNDAITYFSQQVRCRKSRTISFINSAATTS